MILRSLLLLLVLACATRADAQKMIANGPVAPDGVTEVYVDYPDHAKTKNVGGRDGAGLCVFTSIGHAARWQHETRLEDFQEKMKSEPGGGWPEKVDAMIAKYGAGTEYMQYSGSDLSILEAALKSGRMPSVTYAGRDGVFYRGSVAHMVNLVHLDSRWACILDNNFVGEQQLLWMTPAQFRERWASPRQGWAVFLLAPPPPPIPTLATAEPRQPSGSAAQLPAPPPAPTAYQWRTRDDDPDRRYLYLAEKLLGGWDIGERYWRNKLADGWGDYHDLPPVELPSGQAADVPNYGLQREHLPKHEAFWLSGSPCSRTVALAALAVGKDLPDDASKLRITITGNIELRDRVRDDLARSPLLLPWRDKLLVQSYPGDHWHVSRLGFPPSGIVVQRPPGKDGRGQVLHQQTSYAGPEQLATALRKLDPSYEPARAPDLSKQSIPAVAGLPAEFLLTGGAALALVLLFRRSAHANG